MRLVFSQNFLRGKRIAIDLTPLCCGGENGGAKLVILELVKNLQQLLPSSNFIILTLDSNHAYLSKLALGNTRCVNVQEKINKIDRICSRLERYKNRLPLPRLVDRPLSLMLHAFRVGANMNLRSPGSTAYDILFCPFTAPFHAKPGIPTVSIVYDLQYAYFPWFFEDKDLAGRHTNFRNACRIANRLICISDYVRDTVLEKSSVPAEQVKTVHLQIPERFYQCCQDEEVNKNLARSGLAGKSFLYFPANFWAHKNHKMLLAAFAMYIKSHPDSELQLVLTGETYSQGRLLQDSLNAMGLMHRVSVLGYVPNDMVFALIRGAKAIIFPSLYEGFGMPVVEAMALRTPVLCSEVTCMREVAGDAAIYFDPRSAQSIANAIEQLENNPEMVQGLIEKGVSRAATFSSTTNMAKEYISIFTESLMEHESC